ncbi:MAG TPA: response regulator [Nitrospira sp.]|nr:response regulator [Nitrospira sp.]
MPGHGVSVLIADDDEHVREAISDRLEHFGVVVVQASDGLAALAAMRQRRFNVVVTDWHMPGLDGLGFLRQCRLSWPGTPVILMSAMLEATEQLAAAHSAFGCLRKPFDANRLITLVLQAAHMSLTLDPPLSGPASDTGPSAAPGSPKQT